MLRKSQIIFCTYNEKRCKFDKHLETVIIYLLSNIKNVKCEIPMLIVKYGDKIILALTFCVRILGEIKTTVHN